MGFLKKNTCSRKSRGEKNIYYTYMYAILMPNSTFLSGNVNQEMEPPVRFELTT